MLAEGRSLIRQRNAIEDRAVELLAERPDYLLLRTIPPSRASSRKTQLLDGMAEKPQNRNRGPGAPLTLKNRPKPVQTNQASFQSDQHA